LLLLACTLYNVYSRCVMLGDDRLVYEQSVGAKVCEKGALAGEGFGCMLYQRCPLTASNESGLLTTTGVVGCTPNAAVQVVKLWLSQCGNI
jgi:hypothetical protein